MLFFDTKENAEKFMKQYDNVINIKIENEEIKLHLMNLDLYLNTKSKANQNHESSVGIFNLNNYCSENDLFKYANSFG